MMRSLRTVSIIAPCRNERAHVEAFCKAALEQILPSTWALELLVADGMSSDGTRELLDRQQALDPRMRWFDNSAQIVSTGLNLALASSIGEVIVRMDIHTTYAPDYVAQCISVLDETGADNAGGPWRAEPEVDSGPTQQAVAAAFQSRWIAGGALSRRLDYNGWVDTVYLGCWPRSTFERFGLFDESLVRNQDDEHNLRLSVGGGRVWQSSRIRSAYRPRASLRHVFVQNAQYGYWKPFVMRKHGKAAAVRHWVPSIFVSGLLVTSLASLVGASSAPLVACALLYVAAVIGMTLGVAIDGKPSTAALVRVPLVVTATHLGYGIGSLWGWWDALRRGKGRGSFGNLTR